MLILGRKKGQSVIIGDDIVVTVKEIRGSTVKLAIETGAGVPVYREEVHRTIVEENRRAMVSNADLSDLLNFAGARLPGGNKGNGNESK